MPAPLRGRMVERGAQQLEPPRPDPPIPGVALRRCLPALPPQDGAAGRARAAGDGALWNRGPGDWGARRPQAEAERRHRRVLAGAPMQDGTQPPRGIGAGVSREACEYQEPQRILLRVEAAPEVRVDLALL